MSFFDQFFLEVPVSLWIAYGMLVLGILVINLFFSQSHHHGSRYSQSRALAVFILCACLALGIWIYDYLGADASHLFFSLFLLEQGMSLDNIFVTSVIFSYFAIPSAHQPRVLFYAMALALIVRALLLSFGIVMVDFFPWLLWLAMIFMLYTAYTVFAVTETEPDIGHNSVVRLIARLTPITKHMKGGQFFLRRRAPKSGKVSKYATPVFLSFMTINIADAIFAIESTPAVLSLTRSPFIAIAGSTLGFLCLYSLYVLMSRMVTTFYYLEKALSLLLLFLAGKIIWEWFFGALSPAIVLSVIGATLAVAMLASVLRRAN